MNDRGSKIILCKNINIDRDYKNVTSLTTNEMLGVCRSSAHLIAEANDYSFVRVQDRNRINTNFTYSQCVNANYIAIQNPDYDNKWFFCFIDRIEYNSESATIITFTIDVWTTFFDDWNPSSCFVIREHVSDDTIGANTVPEGLETGSYVCNGVGTLASNLKDCYVGAMVTVIPDGLDVNTFHSRYGGIFSGGAFIVFQDYLSACNFTRAYDLVNKPEAITSMFMIPKALTGTITEWKLCGMTYSSPTGDRTINFSCNVVPFSDSETLISNTVEITQPLTLNGYTPKNRKVYTSPYSYLYVSNTVGSDVEYHYEDFINNIPKFKVIGTPSIGSSIRAVPIDYLKLADTSTSYNSYCYGITGAKYPTCSWTNDSFTNWLTENSVNLGLQSVGAVASIVGGTALIATGGGALVGAGMIAGGGMSILNTMNQVNQHAMTPPQAKGNVNAGDVAYASGSFEFPYYKMCLRYEFAKRIDEFFTRYGYKVNTLKVPNIKTRTHWNFLQINNDDNVGSGNVPASYMENINNIARSGVTIWHNHEEIGNFALDNSI